MKLQNLGLRQFSPGIERFSTERYSPGSITLSHFVLPAASFPEIADG